jgi:hypothetical protein
LGWEGPAGRDKKERVEYEVNLYIEIPPVFGN